MERKPTCLLFLIIGAIEILASCKKIIEPIQQATYSYVNKLGTPLVFKVIDTYRNITWKASIESGDSLVFNIQGSPIAFPFFENESEKRTGDLIIIDFGNGKCTKYSMDLSSGTLDGTGVFKLSNYNNYSNGLVNSKTYNLTYFISEKDIKISQNCD